MKHKITRPKAKKITPGEIVVLTAIILLAAVLILFNKAEPAPIPPLDNFAQMLFKLISSPVRSEILLSRGTG